MARYDCQECTPMSGFMVRYGAARWRCRMAIARPTAMRRRYGVVAAGSPHGAKRNAGRPRHPARLFPDFAVAPSGLRSPCLLRVHLDHHALRKDLLDLGVPVGDALLVHIAQELLQCRAVLLDAERERIAAEHVAHATRIDRQPRQRIARY